MAEGFRWAVTKLETKNDKKKLDEKETSEK
jgi:hypothetical protein